MINLVKQKLNKNEPTVGTWMQIPSSEIAMILSSHGYDWVALDLEHGMFSEENLPSIFRAIKINGSLPFVRIAHNHPKDIKKALDAGAEGIIVPMIETKKQAEDFVSWSSYPPAGKRGIGFSAANNFGKNFKEYFNEINQNLVRVIQIEHINALKELDSILTVPGIDALMIGPYDLSGSMNLTGQFTNPEFLSVVDLIRKKAKEKNVPLGTHIIEPNSLQIKAEIDSGMKFIAFSTDAKMLHTQSEIGL